MSPKFWYRWGLDWTMWLRQLNIPQWDRLHPLWIRFAGLSPLLWLFFRFWREIVDSCFINSHKTTQKLFQILLSVDTLTFERILRLKSALVHFIRARKVRTSSLTSHIILWMPLLQIINIRGMGQDPWVSSQTTEPYFYIHPN